MSDLVFLRTWAKVPLEKLYNPLVVDPDREMLLAKNAKELRDMKGIVLENDEVNKEVKRADKVFAPFVLPGKIK